MYTQCRSWLRHCATNGKVMGSIPYGVIWIFHSLNLSSLAIALGSTKPLTETSTTGFPGGKDGRCEMLTTCHLHCLKILGASTAGSPKHLYRDNFSMFHRHNEIILFRDLPFSQTQSLNLRS